MHHSVPAWLIYASAAAYLLVLWCVICVGVSVAGGWRNLARHYPARQPPAGTRYPTQRVRVGPVQYYGWATIHASPGGIHIALWPVLRLGHPPIFIPEDEIYRAKVRRVLGWETVVFDVGSPAIAVMELPRRIFEGQHYSAIHRW
jgi:hypothetical protein